MCIAFSLIASDAPINYLLNDLPRYRGLSAVMAGIVPKMSVRFSSFEVYKGWLGADAKSKGERGRASELASIRNAGYYVVQQIFYDETLNVSHVRGQFKDYCHVARIGQQTCPPLPSQLV